MRIDDYRNKILNFARTLILSSDGVVGELDYLGQFTIGNHKKGRCQFIQGKLALPYDAINDAAGKENISHIQRVLLPCIILPTSVASNEALNLKRKMSQKFEENISGMNPRVAEALNNLIKAIEEELRGGAIDK